MGGTDEGGEQREVGRSQGTGGSWEESGDRRKLGGVRGQEGVSLGPERIVGRRRKKGRRSHVALSTLSSMGAILWRETKPNGGFSNRGFANQDRGRRKGIPKSLARTPRARGLGALRGARGMVDTLRLAGASCSSQNSRLGASRGGKGAGNGGTGRTGER